MAMTWKAPTLVECHSGSGKCSDVGTPHSPPLSPPWNKGIGGGRTALPPTH
jgi:hypothetical protein